jgi:hypothetical protein
MFSKKKSGATFHIDPQREEICKSVPIRTKIRKYKTFAFYAVTPLILTFAAKLAHQRPKANQIELSLGKSIRLFVPHCHASKETLKIIEN